MGIKVKPLGIFAKIADALMVPVMYLVSGTFRESPQRTHRWNNRRLTRKEIRELDSVKDSAKTIPFRGIPGKARGIIRFHMPIFGGWKSYAVIQPQARGVSWHVGWISNGVSGISRILLEGPVRVLLGSETALFFGVSGETGEMIAIELIAIGVIGDRGPYSKTPLL